ncbi:class I SAM-dependent methyltransferase [Streptomyces sp. SID9124]|uniref:class I SAM-dependent methyltransferase n=1 Tax=Streptomyces sp. SID9124 TaxID=2706108 RepID=UPI0013DE8412|nr:class I SAM-dependent methyltransferase [Streptomyces sp. SID9124]NED13016.1 class I SAM-dependent methyltransferase [Streptomyces sp. SID9124]
MGVSMAAAKTWVERWEHQQQRYAVDREERFTVISDVVEHLCAGRARPLLLDLGCGPGSLAARLIRRLPDAEIVAVDRDPVLLELGRTHYADAARYVDAEIGQENWTHALRLGRGLDAAVSTTALHYLPARALLDTYRALAGLLRPGGALINGDHFPPEAGPCSHLTAHVGHRRAERTGGQRHEDWESWWVAAAADPDLADVFAQREERFRLPSGDEGANHHLSVRRHAELLQEAGFHHVTTVWQMGDSSVLVALKD